MTGSGPLHKALVVAPAWIGDAVMAQPLLMRLIQENPRLEIDALASPWIIPVLQRMPQISQVVENPFGHGELELAKRFRFARSLSHKGYQRAYILPNSLTAVLAFATLQFGQAMLALATLSFLGYGTPPPVPEWGLLIAEGRNYLSTAWWLTTFPGLAVVAVVLAANRLSRQWSGVRP